MANTNWGKHIPVHLIYDIFLRLPAKSLFRFRSISKNWRDTIDSLPFAKMHILTRLSAADEPELLPLSRQMGYKRKSKKKTVHSFVYDGNVIKKNEHQVLEFTHDFKPVEVIAYGLLLFRDRHPLGGLFLCNPLKGEVLELPRPPLPTPRGSADGAKSIRWYEMGFDTATNSYKILRFFIHGEGVSSMALDMSRVRFETQVYTLGTPSWRVFFPSVCFAPYKWGVFAYGDMHYKYSDYGDQNVRIMSFDFKKEEFKETPLPDFGCQHKHFENFELIALKDLLAIVTLPSETNIDIWVLKDYEKKEWVREHRINSQQVYSSARKPDYNIATNTLDICFPKSILTSLGVCGHGVVFEAFIGEEILFLDLETNCVRCIKRPESYGWKKRKFSYTGSVLSLRNFASPIPIVGFSRKYNFLKTAHRIYVSP